MPVEFPTEIQRKKRKNNLQHKFPLVRIVFFFILIVVIKDKNGDFQDDYEKPEDGTIPSQNLPKIEN